MSMRPALAAVVVVTLLVVGCAQTSSPTSPSSSQSSSVSDITSSAQSTSTIAPLLAQSECSTPSASTAPLLANLNLVDNLLVSVNHQVNLFLFPSSSPSSEGVERYDALAVASDTSELASRRLDCVAPNYPPTSFEPGTEALTLIIKQANITLDLLVNLPAVPPPPPSAPTIVIQAKHIISVATTLIKCQKAPCV